MGLALGVAAERVVRKEEGATAASALAARPAGLVARPDPVFLPLLDTPGPEGSCASRIRIQSLGAAPGQPLLLVWAAPAGCVGGCRPPRTALCGPLLAPGGAWTVSVDALPRRLVSGLVLPLAEGVCAAVLGSDLLASCSGYERLRGAWDQEGALAELLGHAPAYGPPMAASVERRCPDLADKQLDVVAAYAGVSGRHFDGYDRVFDVATFAAIRVRGEGGALHVQNGGPRCASVEVWFQERGACRLDRLCAVTSQLPAGGTWRVPLEGCAGTREGTAWIVSSEPPAVAVEQVAPGALGVYPALASDLRRAFDGPPVFTAGGDVLVAPLAWSGAERGGRLTLQSLDAREPARVRVSRAGAPGGVELRLCPRGGAELDLAALGASWEGPLRVESLPWYRGGRRVTPANLAAVLTLREPGGVAVYELQPAAPDPEAATGPAGSDSASLVVAVPGPAGDAGPDAPARLAISSLAREPGARRALLGVFDQNGPLDARCLELPENRAAIVDLGGLARVGPVRASAVISAVVRAPDAAPARAALAVAVLRREPYDDPARHGDGLSLAAGLPLPRGGPHPLGAMAPPCAPPASLAEPERDAGRRLWLPLGWGGP